MQPTADGGFILAGESESTDGDVSGNHGGRDAWIVKIKSDGTLVWQRCIGGSTDDEAFGVAVATDGYVIGGYTTSYDGDAVGDHGATDVLAAKLDLNGNVLWSKCLGGSGQDWGWGVVASTDGSGYVLAGHTGSIDGDVVGNHTTTGAWDAWVVKVDNSGNLVWQHCYGGSFNEMAFSIAGTPDGGYLLAGSAQSVDGDVSCMPAHVSQSGSQAGWVFEISGTGGLLWNKVISGGYYDEEHDAEPTADGSILVCGYAAKSNLPGYHTDQAPSGASGDFYVAKLSPTPSMSINVPPANICSGASVTLTATLSGYSSPVTYHWIKNGVDQGVGASTYTTTGFSNGDQVYCQVVLPSGDCTPDVTVTSNTVSMSVSTLAAPTVSIAVDHPTVCAGSPMNFTAMVIGGSPSGTCQWMVNSSPVGTGGTTYSSSTLNNGDIVSCVFTDITVCELPGGINSNAITVQVLPAVSVSVSIEASAQTVCAGSPVNFTASSQGGGSSPGYQWLVNSNPAGTGGTSFSSSTLADGDQVSCVLTSSAGCSAPNPATSNVLPIKVNPILTSSIQLNYAPALICAGKPVVFTASASNAGTNPSYVWQVNGNTVGAGAAGATYNTNALADGDVVSCVVSNDAACVVGSTDAVTVSVSPSPVVGSAPIVTLSKGQSVTLDLPVTGDVASYAWSPGAGLADSTAAAPVATPLKTTDYVLTVLSPGGCTASGVIEVKVFSHLSIPGAFTPNGDGRNDVFYIIGGPMGSVIGDLAVYDRWGRAVFEVHGVAPDDPGNGWNGTVDGRAAPAGTYVYALRMVFGDGTQQVIKGTILLVR